MGRARQGAARPTPKVAATSATGLPSWNIRVATLTRSGVITVRARRAGRRPSRGQAGQGMLADQLRFHLGERGQDVEHHRPGRGRVPKSLHQADQPMPRSRRSSTMCTRHHTAGRAGRGFHTTRISPGRR
jgi:hypothetical protein